MKSLFFSGEIDKKDILDLISLIQDLNEDCYIYFSSEGGNDAGENMLVDFVNNRCEHKLTFIFLDNVNSAGFNVALRLKCKKIVLDGTYSLVHLYGQALHTRENAKHMDFYLKELNKLNNNKLALYNNFLTEKEIERIKNQEDVYLNDERLRLILS